MRFIEWFWLFLSIISFIVCCHAIYKRLSYKHNSFYSLIASMSMNMFLWMLISFMMQTSDNARLILFLHEFKYIVLLSLPLLLYYHSYAVRHGHRISKKFMAITSIISTLLMLLIFTNNLHQLFRQSLELSFTPTVNTVLTENGFLYYIVVAYVYFFISISLSNFILSFKARPMMYKHRDIQLIFAMVIPVIANIFYHLTHLILDFEFDPTPIAFFITVLIFYYHFIIRDDQVNTVSARKHILDYMDTGVLFINQYNSIYDANTAFLNIADVTLDIIFNKPLSAFELEIFRKLSVIKDRYDAGQSYDREYTYLRGTSETTYHITVKSMHHKNGNYIGTLFTFNDISQLKRSLADYKYLSTHDSLTKLYNRHYYEKALKDYNDYQYFPLGLIICDIRHLKFVNDTKGYIAGDALLINVANKLEEMSPDKAIISRIGSSEFAIILLNTTESEVKALREKMLDMCNKSHIDKADKSVHIGYALKIDQASNLTDLLADLSKNMIIQEYQ